MEKKLASKSMSLRNPRIVQQKSVYAPPKCIKKPKKVRYRIDVQFSVLTHVLKERGWQKVEGENDSWDFYWCDLHTIAPTLDKKLRPNQLVPHFRNHYEISKKTLLARNMGRYKRLLIKEGKESESKLCDCIPTTFVLPNDYVLFTDYYKKNPGKVYIVKPACGSKGNGIFIFKKLKELIEWKLTRDSNSSNQSDLGTVASSSNDNFLPPDEWVLQTYIENPYLIAGRKFDLRFFVLVISFLPMTVWVARDGFARFCGSGFDLNDIKNSFCHLTNTSIQLAPDVETPGFKWPLRRFRQYLTAQFGEDTFEELLQDIANIILTSLRSVQKTITHNKHSFEMYGYDVILDSELKPWLLEVNASPSMDATDDDDFQMKCNLLMDVFNIVDFEENTTGSEIRIGGFDLLWNDGPIYKPCPGETELGPIFKGNRNLNINLGAMNDREEQLKELQDWKKIVELKNEKIESNDTPV